MKNLLAIALLLTTSISYAASNWPDGMEQAFGDGCFIEGMKGRTKDATAEQISAMTAFCKCYAKVMAANVSFADFQKASKKGSDLGAELDFSPAGQRLRIKLGMECDKVIEGVKD